MKSLIAVVSFISLAVSASSIRPEWCNAKPVAEGWESSLRCVDLDDVSSNLVTYIKNCGLPKANDSRRSTHIEDYKTSEYTLKNVGPESLMLGYYFFDGRSDQELKDFAELLMDDVYMGSGRIAMGSPFYDNGLVLQMTCSGQFYVH